MIRRIIVLGRLIIIGAALPIITIIAFWKALNEKNNYNNKSRKF